MAGSMLGQPTHLRARLTTYTQEEKGSGGVYESCRMFRSNRQRSQRGAFGDVGEVDSGVSRLGSAAMPRDRGRNGRPPSEIAEAQRSQAVPGTATWCTGDVGAAAGFLQWTNRGDGWRWLARIVGRTKHR